MKIEEYCMQDYLRTTRIKIVRIASIILTIIIKKINIVTGNIKKLFNIIEVR
jgi:hypothetical protein